MYCSKCGNQIADGSRFCSFCGAPVAEASSPAPETPKAEGADDAQQDRQHDGPAPEKRAHTHVLSAMRTMSPLATGAELVVMT